MKKLYFLSVILYLAGVCPLFSQEAFKLEIYGDSQKNGGSRIISPVTELRLSSKPGKMNYGVLLNTEKIYSRVPVTIKYGNLSYSGSLSRLNSPELSNGTSPFSSSIMTTSGLTANLPGYTSFSNPESAFAQIKMNRLFNSSLSLLMNLAISPENEEPFFSAMLSDKLLSNRLSLNTSFTAGKFFYTDNSSASWLLDTPYYAAGQHFSSLFQFSATYKQKASGNSLQAAAMAAVYESPFGPYTALYRADLKYIMKNTELFSAAFLNAYEDTLTSSGKKLEPSAQFKAGLITKKPFLLKAEKLYFLKLGANAYSRFNLTKNEHPLRLNTGIQLYSDLTSLSFSLSSDFKLNSLTPESPPQSLKKNGLSFQIKNSWYLEKITAGLTLNIEENKYKIALNLSNSSNGKKQKLNGKLSGSSAFSFSLKDQKLSDKKLSASLTCRLLLRNLTVIGKMSFQTDF